MPATPENSFTPSLSSGIVMIICVIVCCCLAYWQYGRIQEKQQLMEKYEAMLRAVPIELNNTDKLKTLLDDDSVGAPSLNSPLNNISLNNLSLKSEWQPVSVYGEFLESHQFLLDSQVYQGKAGYHVIAPLRIDSSEWVILVNRGWIAAGGDRLQLPKIPDISEVQPVRGQLAKPRAVMPGFDAQNINEPVQLFINTTAISDRIGQPVAPMLIQLDVRSPGPLPREWPKYQAKIEMHEFYVVHWLIAALVSVLIFIYLGFKRKNKHFTTT